MSEPENDQRFSDDLIQSADGRYGIGGNTGDGRFAPMPTGILGDTMRADAAFTGPADSKGCRAGMSITRNQITRPNNRLSDRR